MFAFRSKTPPFFRFPSVTCGQFLTLLFPRAWRCVSFSNSYARFSSLRPLICLSLYTLISLLYFIFSFHPLRSTSLHYYRAFLAYCILTQRRRKIQPLAGIVNPLKDETGSHKNRRVSTGMLRTFRCKARLPVDIINGHRGRTASHSGEPRSTVHSHGAQSRPHGASIFCTGRTEMRHARCRPNLRRNH